MMFIKILNNTIQIKKAKILIVFDDIIADMLNMLNMLNMLIMLAILFCYAKKNIRLNST